MMLLSFQKQKDSWALLRLSSVPFSSLSSFINPVVKQLVIILKEDPMLSVLILLNPQVIHRVEKPAMAADADFSLNVNACFRKDC
jgi:hypothetical protein